MKNSEATYEEYHAHCERERVTSPLTLWAEEHGRAAQEVEDYVKTQLVYFDPENLMPDEAEALTDPAKFRRALADLHSLMLASIREVNDGGKAKAKRPKVEASKRPARRAVGRRSR